jgi:diguanylate cyclase (GGDEF)-like protein
MTFAKQLIDGLVDPAKGSLAPRDATRTHRRRGPRSGVRRGLKAFVITSVGVAIVVAGTGLISVRAAQGDANQVRVLTNARKHVSDMGRGVNDLRINVNRAMLGSQGIGTLTAADAGSNLVAGATSIGNELAALQALSLPASARQPIADLTTLLTAFVTQADRLSGLAFSDIDAASAALPAFADAGAEIDARRTTATAALDALIGQVERRSEGEFGRAATVLGGLVVATGLLLGLFVFAVGQSLRRGLRTLGDVARSIARGNLDARAEITSDDELGALEHAVNDMAIALQGLVGQMEVTAERDGFGSQLSDALEMADNESEALRIVERGMMSISSIAPMEVLLADSSKAHLERVASNPGVEAPCCPVESPFSCVAVRRGNPAVFEDSEALNACPKLRGRKCGAVSAVCVPVTFMGRALGVLHATGPVGAPPVAKVVSQLTLLATQLGGRVGTIRSFERSQLQATTDGLTGLRNRRTLETEIRGLLNDGVQMSLVMADLDYFKLLNDTYGHEAGDRALRKFSQVVTATVRDSDIVGRYGGEEFVIAFPGAPTSVAVEVLDRLREQLALAGEESDYPTFTASFGVVDSAISGSLEDLLRVADTALYRAKDEGRNRVTVADERDVGAAARSVEPSAAAPARSPRTLETIGAFQRAASLDDPMPGSPQHR